ncbi:MAG: hypothetical protein OEX17_10215 [Rhodospirillaceae bacterium]|nr:hypothetical protein [Rhodospirillaceae bacterium]
MKFSIKYNQLDWWPWMLIGVGIGAGLVGLEVGYMAAGVISILNLIYYIIRDKSITSFPVQVRWVWLAFMGIAMWPPMAWFYWPLFGGMVLVVFFDRCGIARVLVKMPWNRDVALK